MKNNFKIKLYFIVIFCFFVISCKITFVNKPELQNEGLQDKNLQNTTNKRGDMRIMFYNVENLFDVYNDSLKQDDEFLPDGEKHWTFDRYQQKLKNIAKVVTAIGEWEAPEIIGLCEIENRTVLEGITRYSPLKKHGYEIVHQESPDNRGIDVALLYLPEKFKLLDWQTIPITYPQSMGGKQTRDILYVKGRNVNKDTLHIFVNHWASRWGGQMETEALRIYIAEQLRTAVDSLFEDNQNANIIIMGDFNDFPTDKSMLQALKTETDFSNIKNTQLYNLSFYLQEVKHLYSHKFQGEGGILDQMIISSALLNTDNHIYTTKDDAHVFNASFLLEEDTDYVGYKTFRTYIGYKYNNGYSDHLPVYLDLFFAEKINN